VLDLFGSGELGRIARADVEEAVAARPAPISRMRQVIAERLAHSFATAPHFYVTVAADITGLSALREELKAAGRRYTVNDFILKSVAEALREFPNVNSVCDGRTACRRSRVHLGVAVALDSGLVVPVIRDADRQGLAELRDAAVSQVARAREGRLGPDDMRGGTFTVSNMGMLDVENFAAIINPGETAILAVASARPSPAVVEGRLAVRTLMKMTLSADHRMVDGAEGARFVNAVRARLEDVDKWKSMT
jgi:pyruvate dehydrogenase E2 component (dihydrolipoamide acetyltransferase)